MRATRVRLSATELRDAAAALHERADYLEAVRSQLDGRLVDVGESFDGSGAAAFAVAYRRWKTSALGITTNLDALATYLEHIADTLEQADAGLAGTIAERHGTVRR